MAAARPRGHRHRPHPDPGVIGLRRRTDPPRVTTSLDRFREQGFISIAPNKIVVTDEDGLRRFRRLDTQ